MHYQPRFANAIADGVKNVENRYPTQCPELLEGCSFSHEL
jgi:predicted transcriptional regulator